MSGKNHKGVLKKEKKKRVSFISVKHVTLEYGRINQLNYWPWEPGFEELS